jgi:pimeloyl-ACP methyl ester carboxylesterase
VTVRATRLLVLVLTLAAPAAAQDRPAVFVHGLAASGPDWAATADRLRHAVTIEPHRPSLSWRESYDQQANELQGALGWLPGPTVAIGHSNGGIVSREWSRHRPLDGIVTIGSPHRGAPLVASFHRWIKFHSETPILLNNVLHAFSFSTDVTWVWTLVEEAISWASDFSIWSVFDLASVVGIETGLPVLQQIKPYSQYLADLNSAGNLAREASAVPNRVGIVSIAHNFYWAGPARAAVPEWADEIAVALYGSASALLFWSAYIQTTSGWEDVHRFEQAMSLLDVAHHLLSSDSFYCRVISRVDLSACLPNDGVLADESQRFPNAPNLVIGGPAHTQEKEQGADALREALVWYLHVPERSEPPPPPPSGGSGGSGPPAGSAGTLVAGESLQPGESITSPDGRFRLIFQGDGNLVLYDPWDVPRWASRTQHSPLGQLLMQFDGNVVIYDSWNGAIWSTGTHGNPGAYLAVQNDGDVVVFNVDGVPRWRTGTGS